jgi:hypothetical protein
MRMAGVGREGSIRKWVEDCIYQIILELEYHYSNISVQFH